MKRLIALAFLMLISIPAWALDYYVASNGVNSGSCSVANDAAPSTTPCATFNYVRALAGPGDDVVIRGGNYTSQQIELGGGGGQCPTCQSGTDWTEHSGAITWKAYATGGVAETVTVVYVDAARPYYIFYDININGSGFGDNCLTMTADHILFQGLNAVAEIHNCFGNGIGAEGFTLGHQTFFYTINLRVHDANGNPAPVVQNHGYYMNGTDYNLVDHCEFDHNTDFPGNQSYGLQIYDNTYSTKPSHNTIRNSSFHDNGSGLTIQTGGTGNLVYNNLIYDNGANGIDIVNVVSTGIYQNTIWHNGGIGIQITGSATSTQVKNNIVFSNERFGSNRDILDQGSLSVVANNFTPDPLFTNSSASPPDLSLQSTSGAIGYAVSLASLSISAVLLDITGITRANPPSAGAYDQAGVPAPTLVSASPLSLAQGATAQTLTLTASNITLDGTSAVTTTLSGVTVNSTSLVDSLHVTANVTVSGGATVATGDITITTTGQTTITKTNGFSVTASASPSITSLTPASAAQGQAQLLTVVAANAHFVQGSVTPTSTSSTGITFNTPTVTDSNHLTVTITLSATAATGVRSITFTTPIDGAIVATNSFTVNAASSCGDYITIGLVAGQCVVVTNGGADTTVVLSALPSSTTNVTGHFVRLHTIIGCKDVNCAVTTSNPVLSITSPCSFTYTRTATGATNRITQLEEWMAAVNSVCSEHPTVNYTASMYYGEAILEEDFGLAASPFDRSGSATGTSATPSVSTSAGTTVAGDLVCASVLTSSASAAAVSPYTLVMGAANTGYECKVAGSTATETATFSTSNAYYDALITALKPNTSTPASLSAVSPSVAQQCNVDVSAAITGLNSNFVQDTTFPTMSDMGGINTISFAVNSPTSATWHFYVICGASLTTRDVTLTTGAEVATLTSAFTVQPTGNKGRFRR